MKKFAIICSAIAILGLSACDDKSDLGVEQKNAQEKELSLQGFTVTPLAPFNATAIDLNSFEGQTLDVLSYTCAEAIPGRVEFIMEMASTAAFEEVQTLALAPGANPAAPYTVTAAQVSEAVNAIYGLNPVSRDIQMRVAAYVFTNTGEKLRVREQQAGAWFISKMVAMTPLDPHLDIEREYFLVNSLTGMSLSQAIPMVHGSKHQYDDPNYSAVLNVTADDLNAGNVKWAIARQSSVDAADNSGLYGAADAAELTAMSGSLLEGGPALEIDAPAKYQIKINMKNLTYEIGFANDQLYFWTPQTNFRNNVMGLFTSDYVNYTGIICPDATGKWKLTGEPNMSSLQIGVGDKAGEMHFGKSTTPFEAETEDRSKLTYIEANLQEMIYKTVVAQTFGVVGGNNNWGNAPEGVEPTPDTPMTMVGTAAANGNCIWEATVVFADPANLQFKVRANNAWGSEDVPSFNLGADATAVTTKSGTPLRFGGDNLSVPEAGTYKITLNLNIGKTVGAPEPYTITIEKI